MNIDNINNKNIFTRDWAADERAKMLRAIPAPKPIKHRCLAPGLSTKGLCGQDVSILDRRSVKAHLAGRGDARPSWWNLYSCVYGRIFRGATLEEAMYSFHRRHQAITLFTLQVRADVRAIFRAIRAGGTTEGIRYAIDLSRKRE